MITLIYSPADRELAARISADLREAGYNVSDHIEAGRRHVLVGLLSPDALNDAAFLGATEAANDFGQNMIVVMARPVELPKDFDHLSPLDFTTGYPFAELKAQIDRLSGENAPYAVRMQTSRLRASNRRAGIILGATVLIMFVVASVMIILFDIESPAAEYAAVDTQVAETRDAIIGPTMQYLATALPRSTEAAEAFPATVEALPTVLQPLFGLTATAIHQQLAEFEAVPTAAPEEAE